ncbi:MAG: pyruvate:ferredoxin (flavodoxin) oxidoreductase [Firmicutes bacterium]|nr:pyruvate:ferredoxin (flavodoxin) oxidoreductase [Bacillota bacterium]
MTKMTIDGNAAASHIAYAFAEVAAIYPITPSSTMAEYADEWAAEGRKNLFGEVLRISEMQSEAGAAAAVHGSLAAGALTTTYTASQGLLLMIPNMYKISGELLPTVFHVSARALAAHALSIFGDHQDVMACRQTGFAMLASNSVQENMDIALVAHLATLKAKVPFLHFFDGFRTSTEMQKIDGIDYDEIKPLVDMKDIEDFRKRSMNPEHPQMRGTAQNPDVYFQNREAANKLYDATPAIVQTMMDKVYKLTGRRYNLFDYYGDPNAEQIIIMMGSGAETAEETVDFLNKQGKKVGLIKVRLYRPFSVKDFVGAIPSSVKRISVLDRTKEPGSLGEPLYLDVVTALAEAGRTGIKVIGGRYGLGSKEFNPSTVNAVFKNLAGEAKNKFTVGINDDVTNTSLDTSEFINASPEGTVRCKFFGLGADGTVGANKNSVKIIGDNIADMFAQAYFVYDSKKSGGFTVSHLRFGKKPIKSTYLIDEADFIACHNASYMTRYDILKGIKEGGTFLLNSSWDAKQLDKELPAEVKNIIAQKKLKFYNIDAQKVAIKSGLKATLINGVMQAAFFKVNTSIMAYEKAEKLIKEAIKKTYKRFVDENIAAVDNAIAGLVEVKVPAEWATTKTGGSAPKTSNDKFFTSVIKPILSQKGDTLPVSAFPLDGVFPTGTTKLEKRGVAPFLPAYIHQNCIQCNQCALVCPHGCIRPYLIEDKKVSKAPKSCAVLKATGLPDYSYRIQVSPLDCMGCGSCANVCPSKEKSLVMKPYGEIVDVEVANYTYCETNPQPDVSDKFKLNTVKGSQFRQPLFEFSGACTGCGETPYIKLITQLFGDRMVIANSTGCSSIYGGTTPTSPYTVNKDGHGPAWANSLFEDTAEFGYGFNLAYLSRRQLLKSKVAEALKDASVTGKLKTALNEWLMNIKDAEISKSTAKVIKAELPAAIKAAKGNLKTVLTEIQKAEDCLIKKSIWIFGGDGWAYDIGFGGVDHVLAMGEDVNMLVMDTEVYSNTGGQSSKATPTGSVAKFAAQGKRTRKKDLGLMAMSYGYAYVAQIAMGANMQQTVNAIIEAEKFDGPSIIIAYSTCIAHGIDMSQGQKITKNAVESGYWSLYRYNPDLKEEGKNPFMLESKEPTGNYQDFVRNEGRYTTLLKADEAVATELFKQAEVEAKEKIAMYKMLANAGK